MASAIQPLNKGVRREPRLLPKIVDANGKVIMLIITAVKDNHIVTTEEVAPKIAKHASNSLWSEESRSSIFPFR